MGRLIRICSLLCLVVMAPGCHKKTEDINRNQQQYDVVTESAGGAVSSTVVAPGETATAQGQPAATMTSTSVDTTTSFTVGNMTTSTAPTSTTDGSLAGTLPPVAAASPGSQPAPRMSDRVRRRSDRPPRDITDRSDSAARPSNDARASRPDPEQSTRPAEPPSTPSEPAPTDPDSSTPPATDTTSTEPPHR